MNNTLEAIERIVANSDQSALSAIRQISEVIENERSRSRMEPQVHAMCESPLKDVGSKWQMATVVSGDHPQISVCIMVQFSDGWCICDTGADEPMELIHITNLSLWLPVRSVTVTEDGKVIYQPLIDASADSTIDGA